MIARLVFLSLIGISLGWAGQLRIAFNVSLSGWFRESSSDSNLVKMIRTKRHALDYYKTLGFTGILYNMEIPYAPLFKKTGGEWIYNGGDYADGDIALSLAAMKKETDARGMDLIPALTSLSHIEALTALDPSISEFDRLRPKPPVPWHWSAERKERYRKYDGVAAAGPLGYNPGADQIFREYLRIIKAVWVGQGGRAAHPARILIGHDELGCASVCFIKAGKGKSRPETAAELVAMEMQARSSQIRAEVDTTVEMLAYGDSFVPGDYGETYGLAGDLKTGAGGVLRLLKEKYGMKDRLVVIPWIYSSLESDRADMGRRITVSKARQLEYLERLGVPFLIGAGEDGIEPFDPPVERAKQCIVEWVREGRKHPAQLRGYVHLSFTGFEECLPATGGQPALCTGYSAPLLAGLGWLQEHK